MNDLEELVVDEVAFVDKGAGKGVRVALFKRYNKEKEEHTKMKNLDDLLAEMSEADAALVMQAIEEAKHVGEGEEEADKAWVIEGGDKGDESKTKPGKLDYEKEEDEEDTEKQDDEDEDKDKDVSKRVAKRFRVLKRENVSLVKRLEKMEHDREREAFAKRAETFRNVPTLSTEELGDFLMAINKRLKPDMAEKAEGMLRAVDQICGESSLMGTFGKSSTGSSYGESAMATAEAMAKSLQQKEPGLTKAIALNKVWETNIDLRDRYRKERRGKN